MSTMCHIGLLLFFYFVCCWGTLSCSVFPLTRPSTATLVLSCMSHWICRSSLILATVCVGWLTIHFIMRPNGIMNVPYLSAVVLSVGFRRGVGGMGDPWQSNHGCVSTQRILFQGSDERVMAVVGDHLTRIIRSGVKNKGSITCVEVLYFMRGWIWKIFRI